MGFRKNTVENNGENFERKIDLGPKISALKSKLDQADKILAGLPKIPEYGLCAREVTSKRLVLDLLSQSDELNPSVATVDLGKLSGELNNLVELLERYQKRNTELKDVVGYKSRGVVKYSDGSKFDGVVVVKKTGEKVPYGKGVYTDKYANKFEANLRFNAVESGPGTLTLPSGAKADLWFEDGLNAKGIFFDEDADPFAVVISDGQISLLPILRSKYSKEFAKIKDTKINFVSKDTIVIDTNAGNFVLTGNGLSLEQPPIFGQKPKDYKSYYGVARFKDYNISAQTVVEDTKNEANGLSNLDELARAIKSKVALG